jgi:arginine transport system permease protein
MMQLSPLLSYLPQLFAGLVTTLELMIISLLLGLSFAIFLTLGALSGRRYLKVPVELFGFFIRGTPLLVQIFLIYYGSGQFVWLRDSPLWYILQEPFACAIIAFTLNTSAYTLALLKGAIEAVPHNEVDACYALGMSKSLALRRIILPLAFRQMLPAYSNEVIMVLKGTSLASTITLLDLMGMTQQIIAKTYATIELFTIAGLLYLMLNAIIIACFKILERKANVYLG